MDVSRPIVEFYGSGNEAERLSRGIGPLEFLRTCEILQQVLPEVSISICDVGGAHGVYSFWLAGLGHQVHLLDLSPELIEAARRTAQQVDVPALASVQVGDARSLPYDDRTMDLVILQGPLYHLQDHEDRFRCLREAFRVLKPGGALLAFGITHTASLMVGLQRGWIWNDDHFKMVQGEVTTGEHLRPESWPNLFMDAYFHRPEGMNAEVQTCGFQVLGTLGIEGPAWMVDRYDEHWKDEVHQQRILQVARLVERDPILSPHFVCVARKPQDS
ncbi:class I SAM-dependent methyltransferase [Deinococcus cellulosilyticus]|uniref:Methyltransferase type 11 domain-containing protein n=1 Tax=Deinococcus cellulosilyticus (strain DSM 18568 / NBRC 106333 / KACC 11606 / 5516J-15) TaxID=1223518 RepID=A0A511N748_DEIC1|nr:class I SAM-dependent methyltransferase [Deinococcus cellulosilyticus]GEM48307.1 hypothetical protein DC3_39420 [Deinococcus cellulosilyticus NBRC 106333 = KACC 11606]